MVDVYYTVGSLHSGMKNWLEIQQRMIEGVEEFLSKALVDF